GRMRTERFDPGPARLLLAVYGERALKGHAFPGAARTQRNEHLLQPVEYALHLRRRHAFLVLVEQHAVRRVDLGEALDVPLLQLELALEVRSERREVRGGL